MKNHLRQQIEKLDIEDHFQTTFISEYQTQYKKNNNEHFSDAAEMREFFEDGLLF